jgi:hypothetical protein
MHGVRQAIRGYFQEPVPPLAKTPAHELKGARVNKMSPANAGSISSPPPSHSPGDRKARPAHWVEAGADLTDFSTGEGDERTADRFIKFLTSLGLAPIASRQAPTEWDIKENRQDQTPFVFCTKLAGCDVNPQRHPDLEIITGNNPITGEYYNGARLKEIGYASYMGFQGTPEMVQKALKMLKKHATYIKEIDKKERQFI